MRRGFSVLELIVVIVVIAAIAAIAVPRAGAAARNAAAASAADQLRRLATAFELYHADHGGWPVDKAKGEFPPEMVGRLRPADIGPSPIGGDYDWQNWMSFNNGVIRGTAVGIVGEFDSATALQVDRLIDDGDLLSGALFQHHINGQPGVDAASQFLTYRISE